MPPHHKKKRAPLSADEIRRIGEAYCAKFEAVAAIQRRYSLTQHALEALADAQGWPPRGLRGPRLSAQKSRNFKKAPKPRTEAQAREDRRAEEAARELELYGDAVADVALLRQRGFGVDRIGINPKAEGVRFGSKVITMAELREKAARERRLMEPLKTAAELVRGRKGGRRPGHRKTPAERAKLSRAAKARWRAARAAEIEARP